MDQKQPAQINPTIPTPQEVQVLPKPPYFKRMFQGRLNRINYFVACCFGIVLFFLIPIIFFTPILVNIGDLTMKSGIDDQIKSPQYMTYLTIVSTSLFTLLYIFILIYYLSLSVRRLHDVSKSSWWLFLYFIPFGGIYLLILLFLFPGNLGKNSYGEQPSPRINFKQDIFQL